MQLYNAKIRLGDQIANEVRKENISAAEIMILRAIHGATAVVDIAKSKMGVRKHDEERAHLTAKYASPQLGAERLAQKRQMMMSLFGHDGNPLPAKLPEDDGIPAAPEPPKRTAKVRKGDEAGSELMA